MRSPRKSVRPVAASFKIPIFFGRGRPIFKSTVYQARGTCFPPGEPKPRLRSPRGAAPRPPAPGVRSMRQAGLHYRRHLPGASQGPCLARHPESFRFHSFRPRGNSGRPPHQSLSFNRPAHYAFQAGRPISPPKKFPRAFLDGPVPDGSVVMSITRFRVRRRVAPARPADPTLAGKQEYAFLPFSRTTPFFRTCWRAPKAVLWLNFPSISVSVPNILGLRPW